MNLPDKFDPAEWKRRLEEESRQVYHRGQDVEISGGDASRSQRFILTAPNGSRWSVEVDNAGALSTTAL